MAVRKTMLCIFSLVMALTVTLYYLKPVLVEHLQLPVHDPMIERVTGKVSPLFDGSVVFTGRLVKLNDAKKAKEMFDSVTVRPGNKSYTINKKVVYLCLKDEHDKYYDENMLVYVLLHELSHVLSVSINHTDEFREIFGELLNEAGKRGIYDPQQPMILDYCNY